MYKRIQFTENAIFKKISILAIFFCWCFLGFASGNQNITISNTTTPNTGIWTVTGSSVPYTYTFQPNGATDVSGLNAGDITSCLTGSGVVLGGSGTPPNTNGKAGNVTILTASSGAGAGAGNVTISQAISTTLSSYIQFEQLAHSKLH